MLSSYLAGMVVFVFGWTAAIASGQAPVPPLLPPVVPASASTYNLAPAPLLPTTPSPAVAATVLNAPAPNQPPPPTASPVPAAPVLSAPSQYQPPPPPVLPPPAAPPPFLPADAGPFGLPAAMPSLFFETDLYFLQPSIKGTLRGDMTLPNGSVTTFTTPGANLDFTVSPRIEAGWRLPDRTGEFALSYRFVDSDGHGQATDAFGPLSTKSRLTMNVFDFDYGTLRFEPWPRYFLKGYVGIRLELIYYDNHANDGAGFAEHASNYFVGAGPHGAVEFGREIALIPGLAVYTRLDAAAGFGQDKQQFSETLPSGATLPFQQNRTQSSPNLTVQAGLSYTPPRLDYLHLFAGFQYERFWNVGVVGPSSGDVQDIGGFFGASFDY